MISNFDIPKLTALLYNFHLLTKIRVVVFDDQFQEVASAPEHQSEFCTLLRQHPDNLARCRASDQSACIRCKESNKLLIYRCHAGLTETVAPIRHENLIIGYMMFGQLLSSPDREASWPEIQQQIESYAHLDLEKIHRAFYKLHFSTDEEIYATAQIMEACAGYLWLSRSTNLSRDSLSYRIDEFIIQNIAQDLSVASICREFGISKSLLYKVSQHCYGAGIQEFIRGYRIKTARELLETTSMTVGEIAARVGIPNYNYFTKVFKSMVGKTPKDYRKDHILMENQPLTQLGIPRLRSLSSV